MTKLQRAALSMAVQRAIREGREVTEGGIRYALIAQGVPDDRAMPLAQQILDEARGAVRRDEARP